MPVNLYEAAELPQILRASFPLQSAYIQAFAGGRSQEMVANVRTSMLAMHLVGVTTGVDLSHSEFLLPVTVNDGGATETPPPKDITCPAVTSEGQPNGYVVSPMTTYIHYGYEEARLLPSLLVRGAARSALMAIHGALRAASVDAIVILNNWLVSTNLHPAGWTGAKGTAGDIEEILRVATAKWPRHAIAVRSLNSFCDNALMQRLQGAGFLLVPSRQVYIYDGRRGAESLFAATRNYVWDSKLLDSGSYVVDYPLKDPDAALFRRIAHLYGQLYLQKYSPLNAQYQPEWFQRGHQEGWLDLTVLRSKESGSVDGAVGWFGSDTVFTTPVVGYDTALPQRLGLYRLLIAVTLRRTIAKSAVLNLSSGAAKFKRLRGGVPAIEYSAVYARHLPFHRRMVWQGLASLLQNVAVPLLRKHEL